jgi:hypothetical protein
MTVKLDIEKILSALPARSSIPSVAELHGLSEKLRRAPGFSVAVTARSPGGRPIYHIRYGRGPVKALFAGYPHPAEPVGGLTILALLSLLRAGHPALCGAGVEWHFIPCLTPDGAALAQWGRGPFSLRKIMERYYRPDPVHDVESTFPIKYHKMDFRAPANGTRALMKVMRLAVPDFYYSLHNAVTGGAFCFTGLDLGRARYRALYRLFADCGIPVSGEKMPGGITVRRYCRAIYSQISIKPDYDGLVTAGENPLDYIKCGATQADFLETLNPAGATFMCELPVVTHRNHGSSRPSGIRINALRAAVAGGLLQLSRVMVENWKYAGPDLDRRGPFYAPLAFRMPWKERRLKAEPAPAPMKGGRQALEKEVLAAYSEALYELLWGRQFVRLLEGSRGTRRVLAARAAVKRAIDGLYSEFHDAGEFSLFEPVPAGNLLKAQLGAGLIALDAVLARGR